MRRNLLLAFVSLGILGAFVFRGSAVVTGGSGTATISPSVATAGSAGNTHALTFTASENMASGEVSVTVPGTWTVPQGISGTAGYVTAGSASGMVADVLNPLNDASGWSATPSAGLVVDTADKQEGTGSLMKTFGAGAVANEQWYYNFGSSENWGTANNGSQRVGMWIKSSVPTAPGDLSWQDDQNFGLPSPYDTIGIPALSADAWTYLSVALGSARTNVKSYGFRYSTDLGPMTVRTDALSSLFDNADSTISWSGSSSRVNVSLLSSGGGYKEGTGAIRCAYSSDANAGDKCLRSSNSSTLTFASGTTVSFWIRSSVAQGAGDLQWMDDGSQSLGSPEDTVSLPALLANTWTFVTLTAPNSGGKNTKSYGFNQTVNRGSYTLDVDAMGKQFDALDSTAGWYALSAPGQTLSADFSVVQEGTASLKNIISEGVSAGDKWYQTFLSARDWSGYTKVGFWIRSSVSVAAESLKFEYASSTDLSAPSESVSIGALSANAWTYQTVALSGTRSSVRSYGINYATDIGAITVYLDDVLIGPGVPTFPGGGVVSARLLTLAPGETVVIAYGAGGGTSGVTAPIAVGSYPFVTRSRASDGGTLMEISSSPSIEVRADSTSQFSLSDPGNIVAGTRTAYVVSRLDQYGNPVTAGSQEVYLYSDSSGTNASFYAGASNGTPITSVIIPDTASSANVWYFDDKATGATVTASDSAGAPDGATGIADATDGIVVYPAPTARYVLNDPGGMTAGTRLGYAVSRQDEFGNPVTAGTDVVYLYTDSAGSAQFYDAETDGGVLTQISIGEGRSDGAFWYYDDTVAVVTVTASDNASAPDGTDGINDASDSPEISAAETARFLLNDPGDMTAGTRLGYAVSREDAFGNAVTDGTDTAYLYTTSAGTAPAFYGDASDGSEISSVDIADGSDAAEFWYFDDAEGNPDVTASDNASAPDGADGIDDAMDSVVVFPAPIVATRLVILDPGGATVGNDLTVTVRAEDDGGNVETTFEQDVTLVLSGSATGGGIVDIVNGVGTTVITDTVAETVTLGLEDSEGTGLDVSSERTATFVPGPTAEYTLNDPGDTSAGTRVAYEITRKDAFGNLVTDGSETAYLFAESDGSSAFYDSESGGSQITSVVLDDGSSTATFWYANERARTDTVTATDNGEEPDGSDGIADATDGIAVSAGPVSVLVLTDPGGMTAGTRLGYAVSREDAFGNPVTSGSDTFYLYTTSSGSLSAFYAVAVGGTSISSVVIPDGFSEASFWYSDDAPGTWTLTASENATAPDGDDGIMDATDDVSVTETIIVATRFAILDPPDALAGETVRVTVRAEDDLGNVDTTFGRGVTLVLSGSATGGGLVSLAGGIGTRDITDAVAETVTLSLSDTEETGLNADATQSVTFGRAGGGGGGGGGGVVETTETAPVSTAETVLRFNGQAYPNSAVTLLGYREDGSSVLLAQMDIGATDGTFALEYAGPFDGIVSYGISVTDPSGRESALTRFAPTVVPESVTSLTYFAPPTLDLVRFVVLRGLSLSLFGYASPGARVELSVDGADPVRPVRVNVDGTYRMVVETPDMAFGTHAFQTRQVMPSGIQSGYGTTRTAFLSHVLNKKTDLNGDDAIDILDWGIFLRNWVSTDPSLRALLDFNGDGVTDIADFSLFIRSIRH